MQVEDCGIAQQWICSASASEQHAAHCCFFCSIHRIAALISHATRHLCHSCAAEQSDRRRDARVDWRVTLQCSFSCVRAVCVRGCSPFRCSLFARFPLLLLPIGSICAPAVAGRLSQTPHCSIPIFLLATSAVELLL